ncbi:MAG: hypothetical protein NC099_00090 [Corallococcus sp.]|nr:hypothetical protein [Corallococcus sp.]
MYRQTPRKTIIFKSVYLSVSLAVIGYALYSLIDYIIYGFHNKISFDDCIVLISLVIAILFEGSIIGFIIRSYRYPTVLMKNLVFKNDGTPYLAGIILVLVGALISCAVAVVFFISGYAKSLLDIPLRAQRFVAYVGLMLFVNLAFTEIYFLTFRHESGSFTII